MLKDKINTIKNIYDYIYKSNEMPFITSISPDDKMNVIYIEDISNKLINILVSPESLKILDKREILNDQDLPEELLVDSYDIINNLNKSNFYLRFKLWKKIYKITDEKMDYYWEVCASYNVGIVRNLKNLGISWKKLGKDLHCSLRYLYKRTMNKQIYNDCDNNGNLPNKTQF